MADPDYLTTNKALWDERVPIHLSSDFYDLAGFKAGGQTLRGFELAEVGDVTGRCLVHLQCHFGLDTLSWARRGAHVTGLDFSAKAIEAARAVADEVGLRARFVAADVLGHAGREVSSQCIRMPDRGGVSSSLSPEPRRRGHVETDGQKPAEEATV